MDFSLSNLSQKLQPHLDPPYKTDIDSRLGLKEEPFSYSQINIELSHLLEHARVYFISRVFVALGKSSSDSMFFHRL